ncbi:hypothetical protein ACHAPO_011567 [Fusarium lateritium]
MVSFKDLAIYSALALPCLARTVPDNIKAFKQAILSQKQCKNSLASGFYSSDGDDGTSTYCGDHLNDYRVVYLQGTNAKLVNMDIDCDGAQGGPADDGRCGSSGDTQSQTSFKDEVASYKAGITDLNANTHPYVVFGNDGSKPGWKTFNPQEHGIEPLSIMAVVCGEKLIYGVWADTNGDDGDKPVVGEASISLATACFGNGVNGNSGHDETDVLYIAFTGQDAVPGAKGARWAATNYEEFEASITPLGDKLIQRIKGSNSRFSNATI